MDVRKKPRHRVIRVVKSWATGDVYRQGDTIALGGAETQTFPRLLWWAEANGRIERIGT